MISIKMNSDFQCEQNSDRFLLRMNAQHSAFSDRNHSWKNLII